MHEHHQNRTTFPSQKNIGDKDENRGAPNNTYTSIMQLQRTIGNRAVQQMMAGSPVVQAMKWPSGSGSKVVSAR
jgi:hypothetical protein